MERLSLLWRLTCDCRGVTDVACTTTSPGSVSVNSAAPSVRDGAVAALADAQPRICSAPDFLTLLLTGLGDEATSEVTGGQPEAFSGAPVAMGLAAKPAVHSRGKSGEKINELAFAVPQSNPEPLPNVSVSLLCLSLRPGVAAEDNEQAGNDGREIAVPATPVSASAGALAQAARPIACGSDGTTDPAPAQAPPNQTAFEVLLQAGDTSRPQEHADSAAQTDSRSVDPAPVDPAAAPSQAPTGSVALPPVAQQTGRRVDDAPPAGAPAKGSDQGNDARDDAPNRPGTPTDKPRTSEQGHGSGAGWRAIADAAQDPSGGSPETSPAPAYAAATGVAQIPSQSSAGGSPVSDPPVVNELKEPPTVGSAPPAARDISIQLPNFGGPRVDVQLSDRAGTVHVVVRTDDSSLARDLRGNLPELAQRLSQEGLDAEAWSPVEMHTSAAGHESRGQSYERTGSQAWQGGSHQGSGGYPRDGRRQRESENSAGNLNPGFSEALTGAVSWPPVQ